MAIPMRGTSQPLRRLTDEAPDMGEPAGSSVSPREIRERNCPAATRQHRCVRGDPIERPCMFLRNAVLGVTLTLLPLSATGIAAAQDTKEKAAPVKQEDGKWYDADGNPTFHIGDDGSVDWYTFSGYRRYHSDCHVCHGPDGEGSTYAPALKNSVKTMSYGDFLGVVASGRKNVGTAQDNVMPAFGDNPNVACYMDDLYIYLRARSVDAVGRTRPAKHEDKSSAAQRDEDSCMGKR